MSSISKRRSNRQLIVSEQLRNPRARRPWRQPSIEYLEDRLLLTVDLTLTKSDAPDPVLTGQILTYTLGVTNNGTTPATGVTLTDTLPIGVTFLSATTPLGDACSESAGVVTCNLGTIANGVRKPTT